MRFLLSRGHSMACFPVFRHAARARFPEQPASQGNPTQALARALEHVAPLARYLARPLVAVDVGCRWGLADAWDAFGRNARIVGFDPDAEECARLERAYRGRCDVRFVPHALGARRGRAVLYRTRQPACSSLYAPDIAAMDRHPELACIEPVDTCLVELTTLDAWARAASIGAIDAVKLDTQGSELDVLRGARRLLRTVRVVEVEVEFNPIYLGQPLFGDVDRFLRRRGFVLWRLGHLVHYGLRGSRSDYSSEDSQHFDSRPVPVAAGGGQLMWGHAFYVHNELVDVGPKAAWQGCVRDACLAAVWGFRDLAGRLLVRALPTAPAEARPSLLGALED